MVVDSYNLHGAGRYAPIELGQGVQILSRLTGLSVLSIPILALMASRTMFHLIDPSVSAISRHLA